MRQEPHLPFLTSCEQSRVVSIVHFLHYVLRSLHSTQMPLHFQLREQISSRESPAVSRPNCPHILQKVSGVPAWGNLKPLFAIPLLTLFNLTFSASSSRIFPACSRNLSSCNSRAMQRFCQSTLAAPTSPAPLLSNTSAMVRIRAFASGLRLDSRSEKNKVNFTLKWSDCFVMNELFQPEKSWNYIS